MPAVFAAVDAKQREGLNDMNPRLAVHICGWRDLGSIYFRWGTFHSKQEERSMGGD